MPERHEIAYFGAGPASLPTPVLERAAKAMLNHNNAGVGLIEQSHRSASSTGIITDAIASLTSLLSIPDTHTALFMQGGGTSQFSAVVYSLVGHWVAQQLWAATGDIEAVRARLATAKADYLVTGSWSSKAAAEARRLLGPGFVNIACNPKRDTGSYGTIPPADAWALTPAAESMYTYLCSNETVDGVEFAEPLPAVLDGRLLVADMSSNILSRRVDVSKYALIFAGAQKNLGGAGVTLVIVNKKLLEAQADDATLRALGLQVPPVMLHYPPLAGAQSLYNTLPIFDVFICGAVMAGLLERGGLAAQEAENAAKAASLYAALDGAKDGVYEVVPAKDVRSRMNVCFRIKGGAEVEARFLKGAEQRGLTGLKGHRSVGGLRASLYNSVGKEATGRLVEWVKEFAETL
ncbi:pyridoxal phosphate-dependent transferase [Geopyxis carbonaria]|nr:pyridoxal phosphate-dependent transferase [Geopyxis carbonaria]